VGNPIHSRVKNLNAKAEPFFTQSFPFVSLSLDYAKKNIIVDSTNDNVYIKIPESSVSVAAIVSEISTKVSHQPEELIILDSKLIPVTDGKGQYM